MKNILHWLFLAGLTGLVACHKSSNSKSTAPGTDTTVTVYAAGWSWNGPINTATVWKNDTATLLPPAATADTGSYGYSVAVSGTDVYVAGNSPHGAVVWKNGVEQVLSPTGQDYAIALAGTDIYVAGSQLVPNSSPNFNAIYWKNGQPTILSPGLEAAASWVTIVGSDVYICGYGVKAGTYARAMYWKNGAEVWMNPDTACSSNQILVQGTDVYVTGTLNATAACYWKNGQLVVLPSGSLGGASAAGIAIVGNDVYIAGSVYNPSIANFNAVYWKNGQLVYLADPSVPAQANYMAVSGNDIYIGGTAQGTDGHGNPQFNPVYWKNGKMVSLNNAGTTGNALIYSILVKAG